MRLSIFLTSYNRPVLLARCLDSLLAQEFEDWRCFLLDDNSGADVVEVIQNYDDPRIEAFPHDTTAEDRQNTTRYSVLLNQHQWRAADGDVVVHTCDNVEYHPACFRHVVDYFSAAPHRAGYVLHARDLWSGSEVVGPARMRGHWDHTPPSRYRGQAVGNPAGHLDHSQVFFRWPVPLRWREEPEFRKRGDAQLFSNYVAQYGSIKPIPPVDVALSREHLPL